MEDIDRYSLLVAEYRGQNVPPEAGIQLPSSFLLGSLKYISIDMIIHCGKIRSSLPRLCKVCPMCHHIPRQLLLVLRVPAPHAGAPSERVAEHVRDLVSVHYPGPGRPWGVFSSVTKLVQKYPEKKLTLFLFLRNRGHNLTFCCSQTRLNIVQNLALDK